MAIHASAIISTEAIPFHTPSNSIPSEQLETADETHVHWQIVIGAGQRRRSAERCGRWRPARSLALCDDRVARSSFSATRATKRLRRAKRISLVHFLPSRTQEPIARAAHIFPRRCQYSRINCTVYGGTQMRGSWSQQTNQQSLNSILSLPSRKPMQVEAKSTSSRAVIVSDYSVILQVGFHFQSTTDWTATCRQLHAFRRPPTNVPKADKNYKIV